MTHYEEDITIGAGVTYPTGGLSIIVTKGIQVLLVDNVGMKAFSTAPGVGNSSQIASVAAVVGSESGQAFRLKAYSAVSAVGALGTLQEITAGATSSLLNGNVVHVAYEGT